MLLQTNSPARLHIASMKHFLPDELHVTRVYEYSVLILMLEGELRFRENGREVTVRAGEYYIQRDGLLQEGVPMKQPLPVYFYMEFSGGNYANGGSGIPLFGKFRSEEILSVINACSTAYSQHTANRFLLNSYMFRIFSALIENAPSYSNTSELLSMVRRYINAEYASAITLSSLSKKFGYHADYLARLFRRKYGISVYQYLISVRMEHADWLIRNTDMKITDIPDAVGYHDHSAFYRAFEKYYRLSPAAAREKR